MPGVDVTVLIPTHDHGPLMERAVDSVLRQTVQDFEVFIVGDGVPDVARPYIERVLSRDGRIRFFDGPKRGRTGEPHRNAVLAEASGRVVCYLGDDDLWLPDHLEHMAARLARVDFAHGTALRIHPDGHGEALVVDVANPGFRRLVIEGSSRIHFSSAGHTMDLFRRLPEGWREAPPGVPTDYYMWRHILERPDVTAATLDVTTVVVFPTPWRADWTIAARDAEMADWQRRLGEPDAIAHVRAAGFAAACQSWLELHEEAGRRLAVLDDVHQHAAVQREHLEAKERVIQELNTALTECRDRIARLTKT